MHEGLLERFQMFEGATHTLSDGSAVHVPVNRGEFPDGAKRGNRTRRHHVGGQNGAMSRLLTP